MSAAVEQRWFYVGDGQLRLKEGEEWTDTYQAIENPRDKASESAVVLEPDSEQDRPGARSRGRTGLSLLILAGLVALAGAGAAYASGALKPGKLESLLSAVPSVTAAAPAKTSQKPIAWNGGGYTKADYAKRVGGVPVWVGDVRGDSGDKLATHVDLMGLGFQFNEIGKLPAPPGVDPAWWAANNKMLSTLSQQAADKWAGGDRAGAMSGFDVVVKRSNTMISKVNTAFGLRIALSKTTALR